MLRFISFTFIGIAFFLAACVPYEDEQTLDHPTMKNNQKAARFNVQLGVGYLSQGDTKRAKRKFQLALEQAPNWPVAYDAMALFLEHVGELDKAKEYYKKAISLAPKEGAAHNNFGTYLCRRKDYQGANEQFLLAVKDSEYIGTAEAYENAGLCALSATNFVKAKEYFQKAIEQDGNRGTSLIEMANIFYKEKKYTLANNFYNGYNRAAEPTAESLFTGIKIANKLGDEPSVISRAELLKIKFPASPEYQQYRNGRLS